MRVTAADISPDFTFHIFFNGVEIGNCIMADDEKGEIEIYKMRNGSPIVDGGEFKTIKECGEVVIEKRLK